MNSTVSVTFLSSFHIGVEHSAEDIIWHWAKQLDKKKQEKGEMVLAYYDSLGMRKARDRRKRSAEGEKIWQDNWEGMKRGERGGGGE